MSVEFLQSQQPEAEITVRRRKLRYGGGNYGTEAEITVRRRKLRYGGGNYGTEVEITVRRRKLRYGDGNYGTEAEITVRMRKLQHGGGNSTTVGRVKKSYKSLVVYPEANVRPYNLAWKKVTFSKKDDDAKNTSESSEPRGDLYL